MRFVKGSENTKATVLGRRIVKSMKMRKRQPRQSRGCRFRN